MNVLINIDVDDLDGATKFYCAAFDLSVGRRFGTSGIELLGGTSPVYLLEKACGTPATSGGEAVRSYERHWTPVHLDFVVEEIEAAVQRAEKAGARLERPISTNSWGKLALMADPFGHGFCLIEFRGRGYDEIAD